MSKKIYIVWMSWGEYENEGEFILSAYRDKGLAETLAASLEKQWPEFKKAWDGARGDAKRQVLKEDYPAFFDDNGNIIPTSLYGVYFEVSETKLIGE